MEATGTESSKTAPEAGTRSPTGPLPNYFRIDILLRFLLLAFVVTAMVVLVTSKQTLRIPIAPSVFLERDAKFNYTPALIYLLVALVVTILYSIITILSSCSFLSKTASANALFTLIVLDTLMAGIMASATGTAGGIAYLGLKGNAHINWNKICNNYGKFCRHIGSSTALSLVASIILVALVLLSAYSLSKRSYH